MALDVTGIAPTAVPDDGGTELTIIGTGFVIGDFYNVFIEDASIGSLPCYSGVQTQGADCLAESTTSISCIMPKCLVGGPYDVRVAQVGGSDTDTLNNPITVHKRTYTTPLYGLRASIPLPRDSGAKSVRAEPYLSSITPHHPLYALVSAVADELFEIAGFLMTRTTAVYSGGATLTVESTDRFLNTGTLAVKGAKLTYTGRAGLTFTGVSGGTGIELQAGSVVVDQGRRSTQLDLLRASFFISTVTDPSELEVIGRNIGFARPLGVSSAAYQELLRIVGHGARGTDYVVEQALDVMIGEDLWEIWRDRETEPATLFVQIPFIDDELDGKSFLLGGEETAPATDGSTTMLLDFIPDSVYGIWAGYDINRSGTNYALKNIGGAPFFGSVAPDENTLSTLSVGTFFIVGDLARKTFVTDLLTDVVQGWTIDSVVSATSAVMVGPWRSGGRVLDSSPTVFQVDWPTFPQWMAGAVSLEIDGSANGNDGTYDVDTVDSMLQVTLIGAAFETELNLQWRLKPKFRTSGTGYRVSMERANIASGPSRVSAPTGLRLGTLVRNIDDLDDETSDKHGFVIGDPIRDDGWLWATATGYLQAPPTANDSAHTGKRTYLIQYKALTTGVGSEVIFGGENDGASDDGFRFFIDWAEVTNATKLRVKNAAGADIMTADYAFKPTVGVTYFFMIVLDFGASNTAWVRVYTAGLVTHSLGPTAIAAGQSWTSSVTIGADNGGVNPSDHAQLRNFWFYKLSLSDPQGAATAIGITPTAGEQLHYLSGLRKPQSIFVRTSYLVDYRAVGSHVDSQLMPDLRGKGERHPLYLWDFGFAVRTILALILPAGVFPEIVPPEPEP